MDLKQLAYFTAIAEGGNISTAAKGLHISQPPLSRQLRLLEEELGTQLVERGPRRTALTDAGKLFYKRAKRILELSDASIKEMEDFGGGTATLRLGATSSSGPALLNCRIHTFCEQCPFVRFEVHEGNTFELIELMTSGIIEIAMVRTPFQAENTDCIFLDKEPMAAAGTPENMQSFIEDSIPLTALQDKPLILYRRFESLILTACQDAGFIPKYFCKNDDARTTLMWASSGHGIAIVPQSMTHLLSPQALVYKRIENAAMQTQVAVIWRNDRYLSSTAKKFIEIFR